MELFIIEITTVFVIAVIVGIVFRYFGLPSIIGHVLSGLIIGLSGLISTPSINTLEVLGTLGVTLLLFLVGLEMNWKDIRKVGKECTYIFLGQLFFLVIIFMVFGIFAIGFSPIIALLFSISMAFSSTIVVVKVLSEKKELSSFSGQMSLGILLLQDILAIVLLVFLPSIQGEINLLSLGTLLSKLVLLVFVVNIIGNMLISQIMKNIIKTAEDMVLFSLVWFALIIFASVKLLGLSPEIGGLLAGLSLSSSWGHFQIVSKIRVIRDVFLTMFFVLLGFRVGLGYIDWNLVLLLVSMIVVFKFLVTHLISRLVGLSGRNAILLGINMTQTSEFSLVVMSAGLTAGVWNNEVVKAVTLASLLSMALSTILIGKSEKLSLWLTKVSKVFFGFVGKNKQKNIEHKNHVVLIGGDRTGKSILSFLNKIGEKTVIVDFNQKVVADLKKKGETVIFADASDPDIIDLANLRQAKLIISTIKNVNDSLAFISELKNHDINVPIIADAENPVQARELYDLGVTYVIFPHFVSGWHIGHVIKRFNTDKDALSKYKKRQESVLKNIYENEY